MSNQPTVNRNTSIFENEKKFRKGKKFEPTETKGEMFRKKMKKTLEKQKEAPVRKTTGKPEFKNIMKIEKSLENLKKDYRFPKEDMFKKKQPRRVPGPSGTKPKPIRTPGEKKEMIPMAKGGRAGFKSGSKGCKLAMKGKGRAYGKNS
tara:strand:- start:353 stop:796 length:444 start_codon:yes stop_codon:yes gene_type:complete